MPETSAQRIELIERTHFWFIGRARLLERVFTQHSLSPPVLDLGCGTGLFANYLTANGMWCAGVDLSPLDGEEATGRVVAGRAEALPFASSAFAAVLGRDVLEHVDDHATLDEVFRVLEPGGLLVLLVPAWPSLWGIRDLRAGHMRRYTRRSLRRVVVEGGFEVRELSGYQFLLLPVFALSRLTGRLLSNWTSTGRGRRQASEDGDGRVTGVGVIGVGVTGAGVTGAGVMGAEDNPNRWINRFFGAVTVLELAVSERTRLRPPIGSSLLLVAVKP